MNLNFVSPGYLRASGLSLIDGQWFPEHEVAGECRHVGVINQEAADLYFGGRALGAALIDNIGIRTEIIGIVSSQPLGTFEQHAEPTIYIPVWQEHPSRMTLLIRSSMWNHQLMDQLRGRIESVPGNDPASPVITTLDTRLVESGFAPLRIARLIFATSTLTALVLSIFGLLSVQSDTERQRRRELAVRIALGAQRRHIFFMTHQRNRETRLCRHSDRHTYLRRRPAGIQQRTVNNRLTAISGVASRSDSVHADAGLDRNRRRVSSHVGRTSNNHARRRMNFKLIAHESRGNWTR